MNVLAWIVRLFRRRQPDVFRQWAINVRKMPRAPTFGGWVFRIRFNLPATLAIQSDEHSIDLSYPEANRRLVLAAAGDSAKLQRAKHLQVEGGPFASEEEASAAGERARRALMLSLTYMRIGANFGRDTFNGALTEHGRQYLEQHLRERVLQDVPQVVFDDRIPTRFLSITGELVKGSSPDQLRRVLCSALEIAPEFTEREQLALELFGAAFSEQSARSRFLTLMIAVEALLEPKARPANAVEQVDTFMQQVRQNSALATPERESLCGTLKWLKLQSINRTGQNLASERLGERQYLGMSPAAFFRLCYDVRSEIVHTGAVRTQGVDIRQLVADLEGFVADLLCAPFEGLPD